MKDDIFDDNESGQYGSNVQKRTTPHAKTNLLGVWIFLGIVAIASAGYYQSIRMRSISQTKENIHGPLQNASTSPNAILLTIDGVPIPRKIFSLSLNNILQLALSQKLNTSAPEVQEQIRSLALANVINTQLLAQKAKSDGEVMDRAKIDASMASITAKAGGEDKLAISLSQLGMSIDELKSAVGNELLANSYIDKAIDPHKISVTDKELMGYYDTQKAKIGSKDRVSTFAGMKQKLKEELVIQKRKQLIQEYLAGLRKGSKIEIAGVQTN